MSKNYMRPLERVTKQLLVELGKHGMVDGSRLPPVRQLAKQFNACAATVHNALRKLEAEGRIRTEVGNGTFLVGRSRTSAADKPLVIAVNMPAIPSNSQDWGGIISGGIMQAALQRGRAVTIVPMLLETDEEAQWRPEIDEARGKVDAVILFPFCKYRKMRQAYEEAGIPVVDVTPPDDMRTVNFVSFDGFAAGRRIGRAWAESGRRQPLFFFNVPLTELSCGCRLCLAGLAMGFAEVLGRTPEIEALNATGCQERHGYEAIRARLAADSRRFDCVYCTGDFLALGAVRALNDAGLDVPASVSVVGGSGYDVAASPCPLLTRACQPMREMGMALVAMVEERIRAGGGDVPGRHLPMTFVGGGTTRPEENALIGLKT